MLQVWLKFLGQKNLLNFLENVVKSPLRSDSIAYEFHVLVRLMRSCLILFSVKREI